MAGKSWDMLKGGLGDAQEPCTSIRCGRDEELQAVLSGRFILNLPTWNVCPGPYTSFPVLLPIRPGSVHVRLCPDCLMTLPSAVSQVLCLSL